MTAAFETAPSGRSKCRGCGNTIARGELRLGESLPNPFADGEMTYWFHPICAAYKRPEPLLEALAATGEAVPDRAGLERVAQRRLAHRRLPRIDGAGRAPTGQAKCRQCREPIARGTWRIGLVFYEEGRFEAGGFIHLACRDPYFETADVTDAILHFSAGLSDAEREALKSELGTPAGS